MEIGCPRAKIVQSEQCGIPPSLKLEYCTVAIDTGVANIHLNHWQSTRYLATILNRVL